MRLIVPSVRARFSTLKSLPLSELAARVPKEVPSTFSEKDFEEALCAAFLVRAAAKPLPTKESLRSYARRLEDHHRQVVGVHLYLHAYAEMFTSEVAKYILEQEVTKENEYDLSVYVKMGVAGNRVHILSSEYPLSLAFAKPMSDLQAILALADTD